MKPTDPPPSPTARPAPLPRPGRAARPARTPRLRRAPLCTVAALVAAGFLTPPGEAAARQQAEGPRSDAEGEIAWYFPDGERFSTEIPSPEAFLGYRIGTHHTRHDRIVSYFRELARLSDRATYREIGETYEHRAMPVLTVTSPENHARLEEIRTRHVAAADPALPAVPAEGREVVVHLGYGVHGNETSSSEAAMLTAWWLVAGEGERVRRALEEGVFHIEPVLNPDGRDRHTHWANMHKATPLVADPLDREHNEVWPGGRTNHYWFDLNRDWLPLEHPESRARIDFHHAWQPNVVTDYHEMGTNSTYFFEPTASPGSLNPLLPERLYGEITLDFADFYSSALDAIGSLYFTKEVYDNSYPGYGSTYPNFLGGLGLVFEQASARGHVQASTRHGTLTFPFAIRNHLRTSIATVDAAIEHREKLLGYQRDFFTSALREAAEFPVSAYVFGDPHDRSRSLAFLELLLRHRLEVHDLAGTLRLEGHTFEPGSAWIVPTAQPKYRMVRSIFERTHEFADSAFYDASTWTVSLAYGVPDAEVTTARPPMGERVTALPARSGLGRVPRSGFAYLLDWSDYYAPKALYHLLENGVYAEVAFEPFTSRTNEGERDYPRGSISIPVRAQSIDAERLHRLVLEAERHAGVALQATETGYSVRGIDLGSGSFRPLEKPRVLMPVGDGISQYEAGQLWHMLDVRFAIPVTKVDVRHWGRLDLAEYDVLILPSGSYGFLSGESLEGLRRWIRGGGTLVALRTAAVWAQRNDLAPNAELVEEETAENPLPRRDFADAAAIRGAQAIGGSIWEADLDVTHPLGFGYHRRTLPVWRDHALFFRPSANPYSTVVRLTDDPHLSGYISAANLERLRGSPSLLADRLGGGSVLLFLDNPNFRGYWYGTNRLFLNALFFGRHVTVPAAP